MDKKEFFVRHPGIKEKYSYLKRNKRSLIGFGLVSAFLLTLGFISFASSDSSLLIILPFIIFMGLYLLVSYGLGMFSQEFDFERHRRIVDLNYWKVRNKTVDIYLPICGEDINIIKNAWNHVKDIRWRKKKVFVLDDGKSDEARELAKQYGFYYVRRETNHMKKSGNLRNAFFQTNGDYILILDADFCPRPEILNELTPYMIENPKCAIVQSPQYFEVSPWMGWIEQGAAQIQEFFYRYTQVSRNKWKGSICVGTSALYRREALQRMGGFRLKEWSEDVWNGFSLVDRGWQIEYVAINLSKGRCPDTLRQLFSQQYRWACGSLSLGKNSEFWKSTLTPMQKICYVSGMMYFMFSAFIPFLILVPGVVVIWLFPEHVFYANIGYYLPSLLYGTLVYKLWSHYKGTGLGFFVIRLFTYFVNFFALKDTIFNTTMGWVATGKKQQKRHINFLLYQILVVTLVFGNIIGITSGYFVHAEIVSLFDMLPSFFSSAFYGTIFMIPVVDDLISKRN